ncbi:beta strand repeat-containing protein [Bartonella sp. WD16.2]|uniref:beta strand repeat-containing protein n=1 Tax=Bartonella sp. WD16.2 TaxID=1933904 RepID=UPI0009998A7D|nr:right-handed parallel beta-helix repeat-containing protein [Bartonella sp. WD16.2]AQX19256.1 Right handed beta helix region [Bartonella sp. WD16.2]
MVMRRVLKHHVCLCVLSTAIVAGLALITSQKVYAQVQETKNCMGLVQDMGGLLAMHHDKREGKIVCNSSSGTRVLQGVREIDMSNPDDGEEAVKITGSKADITIGDDTLTVTDSNSSDKSAIRVEQGARLTLKENVSITDVQKVMEVEGSGSVITVNGGTFGLKDKIGARKDGGGRVMIEVKNEGRIVFDKRAVGSLTISGGEGAKTKVTGIEVSETGGEVEMRKGTTLDFTGVTEAIKIKGSAEATVSGGGTINVTGKSTGIKMEGLGKADVMNLTVNGSGGATVTGAEVSNGTLMMNMVKLMQVTTGAKVTGGGTLKVLEGTITGKGTGTGVEMDSSGTVTLTSVKISEFAKGVEAKNGQLVINGTSTITVTDGGTGLNITGGSATMMGGSITGTGGARSRSTGVYAGTSETVTLTNVNISNFKTGVEAIKGQLVINGTSTITVTENGTGVKVGGTAKSATLTDVTIKVEGSYGTGLNITGGSATMTGGSITGKDGNQGTGVMVGTSQTVTLTSVGISQVMTGVEVTKGILKVTEGSIEGKTYGVKVTGGNATMTGTTITGENGTGVWMEGSGTAKLTGVTVTGGSRGVWVQGNGRLEMTEGSIEFTGAHGVYVRDNATAKLTEVTITGKTYGVYATGGKFEMNMGEITGGSQGVYVSGMATSAELTKVKIKGGGGTGVYAGTARKVTLNMVEISKVKMGVDAVAGELVVNMGSITVTNGGTGVKVGGSVKSAELTGTQIKGGGKGTGVWMEGGKVTMTGGSITNVLTGIDMAGSGTLTVEDNTTISFTGDGTGVKVGATVQSATLTGVTIRGDDGKGTGVEVKAGDLTVTGGEITNVQMGIDMSGSGTLKVEDGTRIEFKGTHGVKVGTAVTSTTLTGVTIRGEGKGTGVWMEGGNLTVKGGSITNVLTGIDMAGSGTLTVEDGTRIEFKGTHGVKVGGSVQSTQLTGVTIRGNDGKGTGVEVKAGDLTVTGGEITNVQMGIAMSGSGTLKVEDGTRIEFKGTHGVKVGTAVTSTTLTGVTIRGEGKGTGVWMEGGNLTVKGGEITNVQMGIDMSGSGELKVEDGTRISFKGTHGIGVWGDVTVSLTGTKIMGGGSNGSNTGIGVIMAGKMMTMEKVDISGVGKGVYVMRGEVMMDKVDISGVQTGIEVESGTLEVLGVSGNSTINFTGDGYGVKVGASVKSVRLTDVRITGGDQGSGTGVWANSSEKMTLMLDKVGISGVVMGVNMLEGEMLEIKEGTISFKAGYGVRVGDKVKSARLMGTQITGDGSGYGVWAMGKMMTMDKVNISNVQMGVEVKAGNLTITGGSIKEVQTGIAMLGNGMLKVEDNTTISFTRGYGVYVGKEVKSATLMGTVITGGKAGYGVYVSGGTVMVSGGSIKEVQTGIVMMGKGTLEVKDNTTINFTRGYGVYVRGSVKSAELTGTVITGGKAGYGVYAGGEGRVTVKGGSIKGVWKGVEVLAGDLTVKGGTTIHFMGDGYGVKVGKLVKSTELTEVTITGGRSGMGVWMEGEKMTMTNVDISQVGMGVYAEGKKVMVSGGTIKEVEKGIVMIGDGMLMVKDRTKIEFKGDGTGAGVYMEGSVNARLTGTQIIGEKKQGKGVMMEEGKVMLENVHISEVGTGVEVMRGEAWLKETHLGNVAKGMNIENGDVFMEGGEMSFDGDYGINLARGNAALRGVNMTYTGSDKTANFINVEGGTVLAENVTITGNDKGQGLKVIKGGAVWLKNTTFTNVKNGMTVEGRSTIRMEKGGITFKEGHGIYLSGGQALLSSFNITGQGRKSIGMGVSNSGEVMMRGVEISKVGMGIRMTSGNLVMNRGSIAFNGDYGINLVLGHALLNELTITGSGISNTGTGVEVGYGGKVIMKGVNVSGVAMGVQVTTSSGAAWLKETYFTDVKNGIIVTEGNVIMDKGGIAFKGDYGINLAKGNVVLKSVNMTYAGSDKTANFMRVEGGTVLAENVTISTSGNVSKGLGLKVIKDGKVVLKNTTFTNVKNGMTVTEGVVRMEGGEISFDGKHGIDLIQGQVALMVVKMTYQGNSPTADFIKITGEDTTTNAVETILSKKKAAVVAANLTINGNGHGQGLHVIRGGRVVLMKPTYTDVYNGMTIKEGAVQVLGGEMTFKGEHAVYLNRGHALLTNVAMKYTGDNDKSTFLKVEAKGNALNTADIRGTGIKIEGNGHVQGVHVENGGRVMLESAVFSNIKNGVTVLNGEFWMKKGEIEFKGEHAVSLSTGKVVLNGVIMNYGGDRRVKRGANSTKFIKVEGKGANLTAVKVMIIGNDNGQADGLMV